MGLLGSVVGMFSKKKTLKAIIVLPSKNVEMINVNGGERQFSHKIGETKKLYTIDEKSIYFFKGQPMLFYHHGCSSPVLFSELTGDLSYSLSSDEMSSLAESKAIQDLLTAASGEDKRDLLFYLVMGNAIASVVILLITTGVVKIGG
jgi:hypothetical protein